MWKHLVPISTIVCYICIHIFPANFIIIISLPLISLSSLVEVLSAWLLLFTEQHDIMWKLLCQLFEKMKQDARGVVK